MKLLNVGCGGQRPPGPTWVNLDELRKQLIVGSPERTNLDAEDNYVEHTLLEGGPMPFKEEFDGVLIQHVVEHFTCHDAVTILKDCRRVLKPGGIIAISVPNAAYFLEVYEQDTVESSVKLFGEPMPGEWYSRFFDFALFFEFHKQVLTFDSLRCLALKAGFTLDGFRLALAPHGIQWDVVAELKKQFNRLMFSTILWCAK